MPAPHRLYALPHSLYSGRARSYLIKQGIPYRELSTGHESFKAEVLPQTKRASVPTLVTPEGEAIRDGAAIIEYFEAATGYPCRPTTPKQRVISDLFDVIGAEGLLRPAMHYRWNFPEENLAFLRYYFVHSQRQTPEREAKAEAMMDRMRMAGAAFGVSKDAHSLIETLYMEFLGALDAHLATVPYLLGWKPCIGDFGLIAPMFAHLGRDPKPLHLMQRHGAMVYRWVERMNRQTADLPEHFDAGSDWLADDEVPDTLLTVLKVLAKDFLPETRAAARQIDTWLQREKPATGTTAERFIGSCDFSVSDQSITAAAQPYRFLLLQRMQDFCDQLADGPRAEVEAMLSAAGLSALLQIRLCRRQQQRDNREVWV